MDFGRTRNNDEDSFDSDQQREIALLDQQWNDLVNEYIADAEVLDSTISENNQNSPHIHQDWRSQQLKPISENLESPIERTIS